MEIWKVVFGNLPNEKLLILEMHGKWFALSSFNTLTRLTNCLMYRNNSDTLANLKKIPNVVEINFLRQKKLNNSFFENAQFWNWKCIFLFHKFVTNDKRLSRSIPWMLSNDYVGSIASKWKHLIKDFPSTWIADRENFSIQNAVFYECANKNNKVNFV